MRDWEALTLWQKLIIGTCILLIGMLAPEIALLVQFGGIEVAFAFLVVYAKPLLTWLSAKYQSVQETVALVYVSYVSSASARPKVFATQAAFFSLACVLTGSLTFSIAFLMPGMLFNTLLV